MKRLILVCAGVILVATSLWGFGSWQHMRDSGEGYEPPRLDSLSAGHTHWGDNRYVEYIVGELPLILSAPHGGTRTPTAVRDRTRGYPIGDSGTQALTRRIADALYERTGRRPHVIISHLARKKLDPNRALDEAADGDSLAERAWREYHGFIDTAKQDVTKAWGAGLYLDIHGHGHRTPWIELGYVLSNGVLNRPDETLNRMRRHSLRALAEATSMSVAELIRGPQSLGALLTARGYRTVPSPEDPGPGHADYFSGGYSTHRHGSYFKGPISAIQIEHPKRGVRDTEENQRVYAQHFAEVLIQFMETHYGFTLHPAEQP